MSETPKQGGMSRRDAMMYAIALVGGGAGLSVLNACSDNKAPVLQFHADGFAGRRLPTHHPDNGYAGCALKPACRRLSTA